MSERRASPFNRGRFGSGPSFSVADSSCLGDDMVVGVVAELARAREKRIGRLCVHAAPPERSYITEGGETRSRFGI